MKAKSLIFHLLLPLAVGGLSSLLTRSSMEQYNRLSSSLSPPAWIFPIVWTILFLLMGISAYIIASSSDPNRCRALRIYGIQLFINFIWPLIFFRLEAYFIAFLWILLLIFAVVLMIRRFYAISPVAAYLQIPYLLWLLFAAYLNFNVFLLN